MEFALNVEQSSAHEHHSDLIDLRNSASNEFIDRTPLILSSKAPIEYAVEIFGKLGLSYLVIVGNSARYFGVTIKKRLLGYLDRTAEK
ncbi:hypothetical protein NKR23_g7670 [Pleurostoma richardsiae]|uniref:Uncharacterized protein n=1 Tax=Pleurostoma richardsiae TaxID=41990 RepID=A0AA38RVH9_9PEZI|nr:hypothetical protein NKR23_g7670 [Pleurostoma richardsiae]